MSVEERVSKLETQMRAAEDHREILNLLNTYGPLVDSGEGMAAARLWIDGGVHHIDGVGRFVAHDQLAALYNSDAQTEMNNGGGAHIMAAPKITVHGDTAEAFSYVFVLRKEGDRWFVWRASANTYEFVRSPEGWRMKLKYNHAVDGSKKAQDTARKVLSVGDLAR